MKGYMKTFTIEVKNASGPQLQTIGLELKIMSNGWTKFGPRIKIDGRELQAPSLTEPRHKPSKQVERLGEITRGHKRQASSSKRHNVARFI